MWTVYRIYRIADGKSYIGITSKTPKRRWAAHRQCVNDGKRCWYIHNAIRKHGIDKFVFEIVTQVQTAEEACQMEQALIAERNTLAPNGYNLTSGGSAGFKVSESTREKLRNAKIGHKPSLETIEKRRLAMIDKPQSKEKGEKIRAAKLGKKRSPEFCEKMRQIRLGKGLSEEAKKKVAAFHRGRKRSAETCERIAEAQKAIWENLRIKGIKRSTGPFTLERRQKISAALTGKKLSPDRIQRMSSRAKAQKRDTETNRWVA